MIYAPIYKDTYYETDLTTLSYTISMRSDEDEEMVIFRGKAYQMPNGNSIKLNINKICQNYIESPIEEALNAYLETGIFTPYSIPTAYSIFALRDENGTLLEEYAFLNDWSYESGFNGSAAVLSHPINNQFATNMLKLKTVFANDEVIVSNNNTSFTENVCGARYALYYLNAYGGWDSFLITGDVTKTDKLKQYNYNKSFNNNTIQFEKGRYIVETETYWKMHTGILSDEEAENLVSNLLNTTTLYIHDLEDNKIIPAIISNTSNVYKTYKNNNEEPISYEIELTNSQTKLRR